MELRQKANTRYREEDVEAIVKDTVEQLDIQHKEELDEIKEKYNELQERYKRVRDFVTNRIGKIPFFGKKVLNMLKEDIRQNALGPGKNPEKPNEKEREIE